MYNKNESVDIPCPDCKHPKSLTIAEIEKNPTYICEGCKNSITIDGTDLIKGLNKAMKEIDDIFNH